VKKPADDHGATNNHENSMDNNNTNVGNVNLIVNSNSTSGNTKEKYHLAEMIHFCCIDMNAILEHVTIWQAFPKLQKLIFDENNMKYLCQLDAFSVIYSLSLVF